MNIRGMKVSGDVTLSIEFEEMPVFWERKMSELIRDGVILDLKNAKRALEFFGDTTVYYVYNLWKGIEVYKKIKDKFKLNLDLTLLKFGRFSITKNGETFLTYGHKHEKNRGEFYTVLKNECYLLLSDLEKKESIIIEMKEGTSAFIHPRFIHRLISIGKDCLILGIVPEDAGHDYNIVKKRGFPHHLFIQDGWLKVVENKKYGKFSIKKISAKRISVSISKLSKILNNPSKYENLYEV